MAEATPCQTPGAVFHTHISPREVRCTVTLPRPLNLTPQQAAEMDTNLHNVVELVLAPHFPAAARWAPAIDP